MAMHVFKRFEYSHGQLRTYYAKPYDVEYNKEFGEIFYLKKKKL